MICDPAEFLLVLQKWITDSVKVHFSLCLAEGDLTPVLSVTLRGRVVAVDPNSRSFMFASNNSGVIALHLKQWTTISYLDKGTLP